MSLWDKGRFGWSVLKGEIKQRLRHRNRTSKYFCICRAAEPGRKSHIPTSPRPKGWKIPCEESKLITLPLIIRIINDLILYWYRISMGWIRSVQAQLKEMILARYLMPKQSVTTILDLKLVLSLSLDCSEKCFFTEELRGLKKMSIIWLCSPRWFDIKEKITTNFGIRISKFRLRCWKI